MKTIISCTLALLFGLSVMAQAPVNLKLNLEKNKVYKIRSNSNQTMQQSVNGQQYTMEITSNTYMSFKQTGTINDALLIECKFDTVVTIINSPMFKKETNSAKPAKSNEYFEKIMNRFSSYPLTAKISSQGKFMGFTNYKEFKTKVLEILDSVPATQKDQVQKQADAFVREGTVQSMIEPFFSYFPEKPIKTGDQWESSYMQSSVQANMMFFNTFTLNSIENSTAKISGKSEIESVPSNDPGQQMTTEAKGSSTSDLTADISTGLLSQGSITGHIEGTTIVKNAGNEMKVTFVVDSKIAVNNK